MSIMVSTRFHLKRKKTHGELTTPEKIETYGRNKEQGNIAAPVQLRITVDPKRTRSGRQVLRAAAGQQSQSGQHIGSTSNATPNTRRPSRTLPLRQPHSDGSYTTIQRWRTRSTRKCRHSGALFWEIEQIVNALSAGRPEYHKHPHPPVHKTFPKKNIYHQIKSEEEDVYMHQLLVRIRHIQDRVRDIYEQVCRAYIWYDLLGSKEDKIMYAKMSSLVEVRAQTLKLELTECLVNLASEFKRGEM
ncbi:hypothetical protein Tco_0933156 [Tanacetum coccineum]